MKEHTGTSYLKEVTNYLKEQTGTSYLKKVTNYLKEGISNLKEDTSFPDGG